MNHLCKDMKDEALTLHQGITRCPFLRNINEPTNFSFSTSMVFPMPVREVGARGPIFEDGPNFDMSFKLFHGKNGVVPLSGGSFTPNEKPRSETRTTTFNPLAAKAAKAATISLSSFGHGGLFGFDSFFEMFKNHKKKSESSKKKFSNDGDPTHEATSNEWLQNGQCPIAKSYRAVSHVIPLVAKALQPPPGMKIRCPPAIVAARAALAQTAFAKNLRPQPLPSKILVIGALGMAANVPLGVWREHTEKFSPSWFAAVHTAVPFIAMLRKCVLMPKSAMAFTIAASVLGQVIGSRAERFRLKSVAEERNLTMVRTTVKGADREAIIGVKTGHCGDGDNWSKLPMSITTGSSSSNVFG